MQALFYYYCINTGIVVGVVAVENARTSFIGSGQSGSNGLCVWQ